MLRSIPSSEDDLETHAYLMLIYIMKMSKLETLFFFSAWFVWLDPWSVIDAKSLSSGGTKKKKKFEQI